MRDQKKDRKIDRFNLEEDLEQQPDLYGYWAEEHSEAIADRNEAERECKQVEAECKYDMRINFKNYDFEKVPSDAAASSLIPRQEKYQEVYKKYLLAVKRVNDMLAAKDAIDQKRSSLKYLVELWVKDYYGKNVGGNVDSMDRKLGDHHREEMDTKIEESVRRRTRD